MRYTIYTADKPSYDNGEKQNSLVLKRNLFKGHCPLITNHSTADGSMRYKQQMGSAYTLGSLSEVKMIKEKLLYHMKKKKYNQFQVKRE